MLRPPIRRWRSPHRRAALGRGNPQPGTRQHHHHRRSATRSRRCHAAITSRPPRSCRPMATRGRATCRSGQQLIIPRQTVVSAAPALAAPVSKPVAVAAAPAVHIVNPATPCSVSRRNHVSLSELARANSLESTAKLRLGMKLTVPGAKTAASRAGCAAGKLLRLPLSRSLQCRRPPPKMAAAGGPPQSARLAQATATVEDAAVATPVKATEATGALPTFRWPVRGK